MASELLDLGIHDLPAERYHRDPCATPSLSRSIAHTIISQSPLHAWHQHPLLNPHYKPRHETRFDIGTAAHSLLLGGDDKLCVVHAADWRTKVARELRDEARENNLTPILEKDELNIRRMTRIVRKAIADSELRGVLDDGFAERVLVWKESNVLCRAMLDWINPKLTIILDYKTTENASPEQWSRGHISQLGYEMQYDFYSRAVRGLYGFEPHFVFIVQEVRPPYAVSFVSLSEQFKVLAWDRVERAIVLWSECLSKDEWPGYPNRIAYAEPTAYEIQEQEYRAEREAV